MFHLISYLNLMSDFMSIHQSKVTHFEYSQLLRLVCIINTLKSLTIKNASQLADVGFDAR